MRITGRRLQAIIREEVERALGEVRASLGTPSIDYFRPELLGDSPEQAPPQETPGDLDPDDDSDDMAEILDILSDEFNADQLRALASVIQRAKRARESASGYIARKHGGDPRLAMQKLVSNY